METKTTMEIIYMKRQNEFGQLINDKWVKVDDVEKNCLDKQKVREAINKLKQIHTKSSLPITDIASHNVLDELLKELKV